MLVHLLANTEETKNLALSSFCAASGYNKSSKLSRERGRDTCQRCCHRQSTGKAARLVLIIYYIDFFFQVIQKGSQHTQSWERPVISEFRYLGKFTLRYKRHMISKHKDTKRTTQVNVPTVESDDMVFSKKSSFFSGSTLDPKPTYFPPWLGGRLLH